MMPVPKRLKQSQAYHRAPHHERETAQRLSGRTTHASGSREEKGDVRVPGKMRVECKATGKNSFAITRKMLDSIEQAGIPAGELPVIEIEFQRTTKHPGGKWAVVPAWVLDSLIKEGKA